MTNPAGVFQPAIDALEKDLADLERQANGLLSSINLLREKSGLPPRPGGFPTGDGVGGTSNVTHASQLKIHSDSFTGKKLGSAAREYLSMRKSAGGDAPATSREIFEALKEGGFQSGAKDDATALVVLRTMLRKDTKGFAKLSNGKYGLRSWYPNLRVPKEQNKSSSVEESPSDETATDEDVSDENETTAKSKNKAVA